jgi:mannose-1-phosphate guanylyltransferase/mannose-6-phosphate isomerase
MHNKIVPVLLAGGSGTRLWPLSRPERPKQLLPLVSSQTMLQDTLARLSGLGDRVDDPIVVCSTSHGAQIAEQLDEIGVTPRTTVLEPAGRNTAPAVAIASLLAMESDAKAEPLLLILPADHVILDERAFQAAVEQGLAAAAQGRLVTFGIVPTHAETGYGYIRRGVDQGGWADVEAFVEKPDAATAEAYLASGEYLWNSGMFLLSARVYLEELQRHAPDMLPACRAALDGATEDGDFLRLGAEFLDCPSESIDYAVMEHTDAAAVVPLDAGWSDVGSWAALHAVLEKDAAGNVFRGDVTAYDCRNCYVAATSRRVAVVGLEDCIVVETSGEVLVMPQSRAQSVKDLAQRMTEDDKT